MKRLKGKNKRTFGPCRGARLCIGGHKDGVWLHGDLCYKKFQNRGRGEREVRCLRAFKKKKAWEKFFPKLYDIVRKNGQKWLVMENILSGFEDGVIMDVKMGRRTWSASASEAKKIRKAEKDRQYTSLELGVRIVAAEIKQLGNNHMSPKLIGDKVGYPVTNRHQLREGLKNFFYTIELRRQAQGVLREIMRTFKKERGYIFYSSSLLFAYDAAVTADHHHWLRVKMIDFAHVEKVSDSQRDDGYISGLETLIRILNEETEVGRISI
eukprot:g3077.t1